MLGTKYGKRLSKDSKGRTDRGRGGGAWVAVLIAVCVALVLLGLAVGFLARPAGRGDKTPRQEPTQPPAVTAPEPTPSPAATPTPEPTPEPSKAETILAGMTLREKLCQMIMVAPSDITGVKTVIAAGETTRKALEKYPVGGLLYDKSNMRSKDQLLTMTQNTQSYSKVPVLIACDEEGGRVTRLMDTVGTTQVEAMLTYKDQGVETARQNARTLAADLVSCGLNMDLAPVADVWSNPENTVIGDRAYSDDYAQAAELIPGAVDGFHSGGVACVLKHFPGHGSTTGDSHYGSAYVTKTLDALRREDLLAFRAGIDAGADAVMMGHLIVKDVDPEPAVFSHEIVTGLLREEMGFDGVVMTDALEMQAIADHYGKNEVAVKAVKAGVDMLLCPADLDGAIDALTKAVESGEITQARIDESVLRILKLKENRGLL